MLDSLIGRRKISFCSLGSAKHTVEKTIRALLLDILTKHQKMWKDMQMYSGRSISLLRTDRNMSRELKRGSRSLKIKGKSLKRSIKNTKILLQTTNNLTQKILIIPSWASITLAFWNFLLIKRHRLFLIRTHSLTSVKTKIDSWHTPCSNTVMGSGSWFEMSTATVSVSAWTGSSRVVPCKTSASAVTS